MALPLGSGISNGTARRWIIRECDAARRDKLVEEVGCSPLVAQLLLNRDVTSPSWRPSTPSQSPTWVGAASGIVPSSLSFAA